jgi:uncharacterized alpha-E superfamily protein
LISRVADHCFWFGRYLERTESTARVLAVTSNLALDAELTPEQCWLPVVIVSGEREQFLARHGGGSQSQAQSQSPGASTQTQSAGFMDWNEAVPRYMTWEEDNLTSLVRSIGAVRENARSIREVLSLEAWETTNELYLWMTNGGHEGAAGRADYEKDRYTFYRHIRRAVQLCLGLVRSTMLHDTPLDFIWLGVMLERVGQTARVLDVHHHAFTNLPSRPEQEVVETALWLSLLRACSGFEPFMKRNQGKVTADAVASFLIFEPDFPRSLRFCLDAAQSRFFEHIRPSGQPQLPGAETAARLGALAAWLRERSQEPMPADVHGLLTHVVDETAAVCAGLSREMFGAPV